MADSNCTIFVKNIPKGVQNLADLLTTPAIGVKPFGRGRALITYSDEKEVQRAMQQLQDFEVMGKRLKVSTFSANKNEREKSNGQTAKSATNKSTQTNIHVEGATAAPKISKYVCKLYASDTKLNFEQPPPPYLKYTYPAITPDILDAIGIALMSNTRFYTQVLHLMNRMNLDPPFRPKQRNVQPMSLPKDASTQTANEVNDFPVESVALVPAEDMESELETSSGDEQRQRLRVGTYVKRKAPPSAEQYKKKARKVLHASLVQQRQTILLPTAQTAPTGGAAEERKSKPMEEVFDQSTELKLPRIALNLKPTGKQTKKLSPCELPDELHTKRLTPEQMQELPIFNNYATGAPSNKLYIKNLAKDVTQDDLLQLYSRFTSREQLDVKVMQQGRMKGQAFVTFCNLSEVDTATVVAKALEETNGFVLQQKPIVVCYGRKQLGLIETIYVDGAPRPEKKNSPSYLTKFRRSQLCAQPYKYVICIDFEATCWENQAPPRWREAEIIEFPAVLINLKTGKIEAEFHKYVMPIESPKLSAFCTELTGVTQQAVDTGIPLQTALMMFQEWLRRELRARNLHLPKMSKDKMVGNCAFVTWTDWDFGICLAKECQRKRIKKPPFFNQWIDLRAVYREWYKYRPLNFADALTHVELIFKGREHCGRDDARNVGALVYKMVCDGAPLAITKDLTPFQLNSNCLL